MPAVSSSTSPELELELRPPWALLTALLAWLVAVACETWGVDDPPRVWMTLAVAALLMGITALFKLAAGLFPGSVKRITWSADGTWRLRDGYGWEWSAGLAKASRRWGPLTVLVWRAGLCRWWVILTPVTVGAARYRRLSVRWRLQRHA